MTIPVGKVTVAAAGTPVQLSIQAAITTALVTAFGANGAQFRKVHAILFQTLPTNAGKIYFGLSTLVTATYVGVGHTLPAPSATFFPSFGITLETAPAGVDLSAIYLDADTSGEGVSVMMQVN